MTIAICGISKKKNLVNSILSLLNPYKTFDDYFTIEMLINYDDLHWIFERYYEDEDFFFTRKYPSSKPIAKWVMKKLLSS